MSSSDASDAVDRDYALRFHRDIRLDAATAALLLIDLQHASASRSSGLGANLLSDECTDLGAWRFDRLEQLVLPNVSRLLAHARGSDLPVAHIALGSRTEDLSDVPPYLRRLVASTDNRVGCPNHRHLEAVAPRTGELTVTKTTASAFLSTDLHGQLQARGIRQLVLTGVSTNSCVESTGRDGADLGYDCVLVEDACSAANASLHAGAVDNFSRLFGRTARTTEVIAELAGP